MTEHIFTSDYHISCTSLCFFAAWKVGVGLFHHVALIIGHCQSGDWQRHYQTADAAYKGADGEGKENDGGREAHDAPHDARRDDDVLDDLHNEVNGEGAADEQPEVLPGLSGAQQGQEGARQEASHLQVRHETDDADEAAQSDGHGETHEEEAQREKHAVAQSNE